MKKSLSVLMLGMLLVQQLPLRVAFAKSEPAPTETATLSETSATPETPENIASEGSATPETPENIASEESATPKTPENASSEGSATLETPENASSERSATLETPENASSEGSATPETSIQPSAEDSALTEEPAPMMRSPAPMMRSPAPMMRSPASMTEVKEIRYFDKTNPADGIIMMDRNLGATSDDFTSPDSYGYYYQRGNNYGFWNGTAHATNEDGTQEFLTSDTMVDTSAYGLNKPYRSNIFITGYRGRSTSKNNNLRGGDHNYPCPDGYHIPTSGEWKRLIQRYQKNNGRGFDIEGFRQTFKLPRAGFREGDGADASKGTVGRYWSSSPKGRNAIYFSFNSSTPRTDSSYRNYALPLRCFKDSYTPPQTFHLVFKGDAIAIPPLEVYEGMKGAVPPAPVRYGYKFKGWFTGEDYAQEFNFDEPFTKDRTAYAKWDIIPVTELKDTAKAEIEALANLSPEEKTDFKNQVETATDEAGITQAVNAAKAKDAANLKAKQDAFKAKQDTAKAEIEALANLSPEEKADFKNQVDTATDEAGITQAVNDAKAKDAANLKAKQDAFKAKQATAKAEIEALANLSPEEKTDFKNQVETATDGAGITQAVNAAKAKDAANLKTKRTEVKEIRYFDKTNPADGIIMMDRNLGATSDDFTSPDSYGYYYQRGNNYGFWNGTAHATNEDGTRDFFTSERRVDTSAYGLNKPYRRKIFITGYDDRSTSRNNNLRGGDHKGPCPDGYHIPTIGEWERLVHLYQRNNGGGFDVGGFRQTFKLPKAGSRNSGDGSVFGHGFVAFYWTSSTEYNSAKYYNFGSFDLDNHYSGVTYRENASSLRCFKDSYTPPQTFHLVFKGDAIAIPPLEVYEGMKGAVPPAPVRYGYKFKGWFTGEDYAQEFNFDEPFTKDRTAYAKWDIIPVTELKDTAKAEIEALANLSPEEKTDFKNQVETATDEAGITQAVNAAKAKDAANLKAKQDAFKAKQDTAKAEIEALANLSPEEKTDFKNQVDTATDEAGITQAVNAAKAKDAANLKNKKTPAKSESGYSGGGGSSRIYSKTTATTTTINDTPLANNKAEHSAAPEELATLPSTITPSSSSTTASSISSTNKIIRGQLAQLLVFLDNAGIPLKKPKTNSGCQFSDVAPHQRVATQAVCQRGLMGIDDKTKLPLAKFDPNQTLSYADFATVLSRMLFAYQYDGNGFYYQSHINALQELNILATTNPHEKISSHIVVSLLASLAKPSLGK